MFAKKVVLNIISSVSNYELIVLSKQGILKQINIKTKKSKICFYAENCHVRLKAKYKNQTIYQTIFLNKCQCEKVFIKFAFDRFPQTEILNMFYLIDAIYGLPVARAKLNFKGQ